MSHGTLSILIALIGILITVITSALHNSFKMGVFEEKLNNLEKKQDKHNNLIERMVKVEDCSQQNAKDIAELHRSIGNDRV